ncbi:MAG: T9SS type A sorting domain-containing protein [Bacteroidota bacterium]
MNKTLVLISLLAFSLTTIGQSYTLTYQTQAPFISSSGNIQITTFNYQLQTDFGAVGNSHRSYDLMEGIFGPFELEVEGRPARIRERYTYVDSRDLFPTELEVVGEWVELNGTNCDSYFNDQFAIESGQIFQPEPNPFSNNGYLDLSWEAVYDTEHPVLVQGGTSTNVCIGSDVYFQAPFVADEYEWFYRFNESTGWIPISDTGPTLLNDILTLEYIDIYVGSTYFIGYRPNGCSDVVSTLNSTTFYRPPPKVTDDSAPDILAPTCAGDSATVTFQADDLSRTPGEEEVFTFMIYRGEEAPEITIPDGTDPGDVIDDAPIGEVTVADGELFFGTSEISFKLKPNVTGEKYFLFIFPQIIGGDAAFSSGCGDDIDGLIYEFEVADQLPVQVASTGSSSPACFNGTAQFSLSVSNGTSGYTYRLNGPGGLVVSPNSSTSSTPSFDLSVTTYPQLLSDFTVHLTDANGCTALSGVLSAFTNPPVLEIASVGFESSITCHGGTTSATIVLEEPVPGNGTLTYAVVELPGNTSGRTSGTFSGLGAGEYTARVTNTVGAATCVDEFDFTVSEPDEVSVSLESADAPSCAGAGNGSFTVTASGGSGSGYRYSIDNGTSFQGSGLFSSLSSGEYTVLAEDSDGCRSAPLNVEVPADGTPLTFQAIPADQTCADVTDGSITITNVSNSQGTLRYSIDGANYQASPVFTGMAAGVYTVYLQDAACEAFITGVEVSRPSPLTASFLSEPATCEGEADGRLTVTPLGGTTPYTYLWEFDGTTTNQLEQGAGFYTVTITDANDCVLMVSGEITEPFGIQADHEVTDITCHDADDGTLTLSNVGGGNGGYQYTWSDGASANTSSRSGLASGTYSVLIEDVAGCTLEITNLVISNPSPVSLTISDQTDVGCKGESTGSLTVTGSGGTGAYEYRLAGGGWQTSGTFSALPAGDYPVSVRDANMCEFSTTATLSEPGEALSVGLAVVNATCEAQGRVTATPSGGTPPYLFSWEGLSETTSEVAVPAGQYTVMVTDQKGCETQGTGNVSSEGGPQVTVLSRTAPTCSDSSDGSAELSISGAGPFDIRWDHGETTARATSLSVGDNWYEVADVSGCVVRQSVTFDGPLPLEAVLVEGVPPGCTGSADGSLSIAVSGGTSPYNIRWADGQQGTLATGLSAGTYEVTFTDAAGCESTTELELADAPGIQITTEIVSPSCAGASDGSIAVEASGGNGGYRYRWDGGQEGEVIEGVPAGTYQVTVTDALNCEETFAVTVEDPAPTTFDIEDVALCSGQQFRIASPVAGVTYEWSGPDGFNASEREVTLSTPGTYSLLITDASGCISGDTFDVSVDDGALDAVFLVAGEAFTGDTLVVIDISWPVPESVSWEFPEAARVLFSSSDFAELVFDDPGTYSIGMTGKLFGCEAYYDREVVVQAADENGRLGSIASVQEAPIQSFSTYPNPAEDHLTVSVALREEVPARFYLIDLKGNRVVLEQALKGAKEYDVSLDVSTLVSGLYFARVVAEGHEKTIRLIIR